MRPSRIEGVCVLLGIAAILVIGVAIVGAVLSVPLAGDDGVAFTWTLIAATAIPAALVLFWAAAVLRHLREIANRLPCMVRSAD